jgi:hypothetical protein
MHHIPQFLEISPQQTSRSEEMQQFILFWQCVCCHHSACVRNFVMSFSSTGRETKYCGYERDLHYRGLVWISKRAKALLFARFAPQNQRWIWFSFAPGSLVLGNDATILNISQQLFREDLYKSDQAREAHPLLLASPFSVGFSFLFGIIRRMLSDRLSKLITRLSSFLIAARSRPLRHPARQEPEVRVR